MAQRVQGLVDPRCAEAAGAIDLRFVFESRAILLFWQWQPLGGVVWSIKDPFGRTVLYVLFAFGWALVLVSTFLINHFDLFGLRQVWLYLLGRPYTTLHFERPDHTGSSGIHSTSAGCSLSGARRR